MGSPAPLVAQIVDPPQAAVPCKHSVFEPLAAAIVAIAHGHTYSLRLSRPLQPCTELRITQFLGPGCSYLTAAVLLESLQAISQVLAGGIITK